MQKRMQTCKTQKQRRRILRRLWENQRRNKNVDQRNRRMETTSYRQTKSMIDKWEIDMLVSVKLKKGELMNKKTKHEGDEGTVAFWLWMKALYKDEE